MTCEIDKCIVTTNKLCGVETIATQHQKVSSLETKVDGNPMFEWRVCMMCECSPSDPHGLELEYPR